MGLLLRSATLADGSRCAGIRLSGQVTADVRIDGERVAWLDPPGTLSPASDDAVHDLSGYLLLPAPVEPHAHLDTALLAEHPLRPTTGGDVLRRARRSAQTLLGHGAVAVRTHVTVGGDAGLRHLEALLTLRTELAGLMTLQIVASPTPDGLDEVLTEALRLGADLAGGAPGHARDPGRSTHATLDAAAAAGVGIDLHVGGLGTASVIGELVRAVADGFPHPVTLSWCPTIPADAALPATATATATATAPTGHELVTGSPALADSLASTGIAVVVLPRGAITTTAPGSPDGRAGSLVRQLMDAGVPVAGGGGSLRDLTDPTGRGDPLETVSWLVSVMGLRPAEAYTAVTTAARSALGLPTTPTEGTLETQAPADLLALRAETLLEAVAAASPDRTVISAGRVVVRTRVTRTFSLLPAQR